MEQHFFDDFVTPYDDTMAFKQDAVAASAAQVAESAATEQKPEPEPPKVRKGDKQAWLAESHSEAEMRVSTEMNARMVVLTKDGTHYEMSALPSSAHL